MLCEVEFLAVGDGSRPGDAIIVRYSDLAAYQLMVVDGGTANCGETLVAHLKKHFGALVSLEHVVLTHSDADHASGLRELLREIPVTHVWLHIPWLLSEYGIHLFKHKGWTNDTSPRRSRKNTTSSPRSLTSRSRRVANFIIRSRASRSVRSWSSRRARRSISICFPNSTRRRSPISSFSKPPASGSASPPAIRSWRCSKRRRPRSRIGCRNPGPASG